MTGKIAIVTSTRADWGLLHPLVKQLEDDGHRPLIIATYAHLFPEMGDTIQELVEDGYPPTMSVPTRRKADEAVADAVTGFTKAFRFLKPSLVVILGDRLEMMGVATAALLSGIPIAHIAGGTVSEGAFDDSIRNAISQMATLHFPETEKGRKRLILMGAKPEYTVSAGALGVFNSLAVEHIPLNELEAFLDFKLGPQYLLGTFHPATRAAGCPKDSAMDPIQQMKIWIEGLKQALTENPDLKMLLTFPNTDTDATPLLSLLFTFEAAFRERVKVVSSLGRVRYLNAARHAAVVAGNSSSGIVEIPSVEVPVIDVGTRQQGRQRSKAVIHCNLDAAEIAHAISQALTPDARQHARKYPNPYYKADTPKIMAEGILKFIESR